MAWDTEGTRRRLQEAATVEFAAHGPDGTTMSRIAERAGINKERLYKYFGDKERLFRTVLAAELARLAASVTFPEGGLEEIGEFAGRAFDYHANHPQLVRLLLWEGLADGTLADPEGRATHYDEKVRSYAAAQEAGILDDELDPGHLVLLVIALSAWWVCVPQLARMVTGTDDDDPAEHARRRATVVTAAERLARRPRP